MEWLGACAACVAVSNTRQPRLLISHFLIQPLAEHAQVMRDGLCTATKRA